MQVNKKVLHHAYRTGKCMQSKQCCMSRMITGRTCESCCRVRDTHIGFDAGVPLLKGCGVGHRLATDNVDKGQADGGPKASVELLIDLLLVPHHEESARCCEAHNAGPHHDQQQPLQQEEEGLLQAWVAIKTDR